LLAYITPINRGCYRIFHLRMQFITPQSRKTIRLRKLVCYFSRAGLDRGLIRHGIIPAEIPRLAGFSGPDAAWRTGNDGAESLYNRRNHVYANCSSTTALSIRPTEPWYRLRVRLRANRSPFQISDCQSWRDNADATWCLGARAQRESIFDKISHDSSLIRDMSLARMLTARGILRSVSFRLIWKPRSFRLDLAAKGSVSCWLELDSSRRWRLDRTGIPLMLIKSTYAMQNWRLLANCGTNDADNKADEWQTMNLGMSLLRGTYLANENVGVEQNARISQKIRWWFKNDRAK